MRIILVILALCFAMGCSGADGTNGTNGTNGSNGANGAQGYGAGLTVTQLAVGNPNCPAGGVSLVNFQDLNNSGVQIPADPILGLSYVCNGTNGTNGTNGQAGLNGTNGTNGGTVTFNLVQVIEPCGAASSPWKEVLLGLQGGQILSDFSETSSGQNTRLSFVPNGSYVDTDESGCNFTVSGDGSTWSEISWAAGSNSYSSWPANDFYWTAANGWVEQ